MKRKETDEKNKDKLQTEINQVLQACIERINLLQREDLDLYERRKLAIEFKDFVDKYVNSEYRDNFYQFINHILQKYRTEAQYNANEEKNVPKQEESSGAHVEWPINCTHIKVAYYIWNSRKTQFSNPLEIAQRLKQYYYEETAYNENDYDMTAQTYANNYLNNNNLNKNDYAEAGQLYIRPEYEGKYAPNIDEAFGYSAQPANKDEGNRVKDGGPYGDIGFNSNQTF